MADKIGVLGENDAIAVGTQTVYTVPAQKAARVKIMFRGQAGGAGTTTLQVLVNGMVIFATGAIAASNYIHSSSEQMYAANAAAPAGATLAGTVGPAPQEYYLSENDTVQYIIGGADMTAFEMFVVGAEIDV